jgi:hypothetical protein
MNYDLEEGAKGWFLPKPNFSVEDGAGRNGSRGLVCEGRDTNSYQIAFKELPFKPGERLEVKMWIKNESLSKGEPGACVEFFGEGGREYLGGAGFSLDKRSPSDPAGWREYVSYVGPIEPDVKHVRLRCYIQKDVTGRCIFDDVEVVTVEYVKRGALFSSRSDDKAASGKVRFTVKSHAAIPAGEEKDIETFFSFVGKDGPFVAQPDSYKNGRGEIVIDVERLAMGPHPVSFTVKKKGDKIPLDVLAMSFARLEKPMEGKVYFDESKRLVVNGKKTYPLLAYMGDWCREDPRFLPAIARGPIKTIVYYTQKPNRKDLDFFHANGIGVFESLIYFWAGDYWYCKEASSPDEEVALTIRVVNELKDHPALLGWYLFDEPQPSRFARIRERYKIVKALDEDHPCLTVINHGRHSKGAVATCDVLGIDCYPVPGTGTEKTEPADLAKVGRETATAFKDMKGDKPLWLVPQAFVQFPGTRYPTLREMRSMVWQGIANGADGVIFYSLDQMLNKRIKDWFDFEGSWSIVCSVAEEIKSYEDFLLTDEPAPAVEGCTENVVARAWKLDGKTLLLVCNKTHSPVKVVLSASGVEVPVDLDGDGVVLKTIE